MDFARVSSCSSGEQSLTWNMHSIESLEKVCIYKANKINPQKLLFQLNMRACLKNSGLRRAKEKTHAFERTG